MFIYLRLTNVWGWKFGGGGTYHHLEVFLYVCAVVSESLVCPLLHMQSSLSEPSYDRVYRDMTDSVGLSGRCHSQPVGAAVTESEVGQSQLVTDSIRLILSVVTSVS